MSLLLMFCSFIRFQRKFITSYQFAAYTESLEISFVCLSLFRLGMFSSNIIIQAKNSTTTKTDIWLHLLKLKIKMN